MGRIGPAVTEIQRFENSDRFAPTLFTLAFRQFGWSFKSLTRMAQGHAGVCCLVLENSTCLAARAAKNSGFLTLLVAEL